MKVALYSETKMKHTIKKLLTPLSLLLLAACTFPGMQGQPSLSPLDQAATIVAMTLQAEGIPTSPGVVATPSPSPAVPTPTTKPTLFINTSGAKCLSGPGPDFKEITTFNTGTTVDMIAKDTADGYWLVSDPATGNSCWVNVQDATPGGSFDLLPEVTPQVSAQVSTPGRPSRGSWNFSCDNTSFTVILGWNTPAEGINGFRVYRLGNKVADLSATTTTYTETIPFTYGSSVSYGVEAFNEAGASPQQTWDITCP